MSVPSGPRVAFDDRFARELPEIAIPWQAEEAPDPALLVLNESLSTELGLAPEWLPSSEGVCLLIGHLVPSGVTPVAQAYAGHQFCGYSPRLGDGWAFLLGEFVDAAGYLRDVHLKGSGRMPFARGADGMAAGGPDAARVCRQQAMHALGIPTTRSLAGVAAGRPVRRETLLAGAVLTRVAGSHLRVGNFQRIGPRVTSTSCAGWPIRRSAVTTPARHRRTTPFSRCSPVWSPGRRPWLRGGCWWGSSTVS